MHMAAKSIISSPSFHSSRENRGKNRVEPTTSSGVKIMLTYMFMFLISLAFTVILFILAKLKTAKRKQNFDKRVKKKQKSSKAPSSNDVSQDMAIEKDHTPG